MEPDKHNQFREDRLAELLLLGLRLRVRALVFLPVVIGSLLTLDDTHWRAPLFAGLWGVAAIVFVADYLRARRTRIRLRSVPWFASVIVSIQILVFTITGGLSSPVMPGIPVIGFIVGVYGRALRRAWLFPAVMTVTCVALAVGEWLQLVPAFNGISMPQAEPVVLIIRCLVLVGVSWGSTGLGTLVATAYDKASSDAELARGQLVDAHKERLQSLEALSGRMAHELKNPLSAIKGLTQLLQKQDANPHLTVIASEVERMQEILDGLLSFARPLEELRVQPVRLGTLVADVEQLMTVRARDARVQMIRRDELGDMEVSVDAKRIKQVVLNLVLNAVEALEASPQEDRTVTMTLLRRENTVRVEVADNGPVMNAVEVERLFEPYVTTKTTGTGLGLPISRTIARAHRGDLTLEPVAPHGARAVLTLPLHAGSAA